MIFYFKPKFGLIEWTNKALLHQFLLENEGKEYYAKIGKVKGIRSLNQNALYWVYIELIASETGHNADELHKLFKGLFLPKKEIEWNGKKYMMSGSTANLSKAEFGIYMDKICAETNIPIPDPKLASMDSKVEYPENNQDKTPF